MEAKAKTRTEQILAVMNVLAWVAYIGLLIEGGAFIISYIVSLVNPDASKNLYRGLSMENLRQFSFWHYTLTVFLKVLIVSLKAFIAHIAIKVLSTVNLTNPFTSEVAMRLERISYVLLVMWSVAMASNAHTSWLRDTVGEVEATWVSGEFILTAGLVFIISQVFKRGVEIQSENDLTV